jgi:glucose-6-phosphate 1-dehydrogenase
MSGVHSDALVFYGATGDLAYKKVFLALQAIVKHGQLEVPVIGVAKAEHGSDSVRGPSLMVLGDAASGVVVGKPPIS